MMERENPYDGQSGRGSWGPRGVYPDKTFKITDCERSEQIQGPFKGRC